MRREAYRQRSAELSEILRQMAALVAKPRTSTPRLMQKNDGMFTACFGAGPTAYARMAILDAIDGIVDLGSDGPQVERDDPH